MPIRTGEGSSSPLFFSLYLKKYRTTHIWNFSTFPNFLLRIPSFTSSHRTIRTPSTKIDFFPIIKNYLFTKPTWSNLQITIFFLDFRDPSRVKAFYPVYKATFSSFLSLFIFNIFPKRPFLPTRTIIFSNIYIIHPYKSLNPIPDICV